MNKSEMKIRAMMAIGAMLGAGLSEPSEYKPERTDENDFAKDQKYYRSLCKPRLVWRGRPYVRPRTGSEIEGKLNIKAAKRARVRAMKAAQTI